MATEWSLGAITFNDGGTGGVEWWADVPTGWHTPRSAGRVVNRAGVNGGLIFGARLAARTLQTTGTVIASSHAAAESARNQLEAAVEAMIATAATLVVEEIGGHKSLQVRYVDGLVITVRSQVMFTFQLPLVALNPAKAAVP